MDASCTYSDSSCRDTVWQTPSALFSLNDQLITHNTEILQGDTAKAEAYWYTVLWLPL